MQTNDQKANINSESTFIHPSVDSKQKLVDYILVKLGYPLLTVELSPEQMDVCIQDALEKYTKYAYFPTKPLVYNTKFYEPGIGANLSEFNISSVKSISTRRDSYLNMTAGDLFFGPYTMFASNGAYPYFGGSRGGAIGSGFFTTYHMVNEYWDLANRLLGSNPDFFYDKNTKRLTLMPEPPNAGQSDNYICIICQVEPTLDELYGNEYVKRLAIAYAKIMLGTIRSKFTGVNLPGGGQLNAEAMLNDGKEELNAILENIQKEENPSQCFFIS